MPQARHLLPRSYMKHCFRLAVLYVICSVAPSLAAVASGYPSPEEATLLLLEVRLDRSVLSEAIPAYDHNGTVFLPMGELARLLTIGVQTRPGEGAASGFILSQKHSFSLNVNDGKVSRGGRLESFDPDLVMVEPDDLYLAESLLETWFPVDLSIKRSSQVLSVEAREVLPLQARLRRKRLAERSNRSRGYQAPQYPFYYSPYRLLDTPFVDQTLHSETGERNGQRFSQSRYNAYLTGDLLGLESSAYLTADSAGSDAELRFTLGRRDPDGDLLGPLNARSYRIGSFSSLNIDNLLDAEPGEGFSISNRPLTQPSQFDSQTFEGDLPPGWDVELYYNNTLLGYQQVGSDGRYRFEDLPLSYGRNDFQLVFSGPLGQTRVENYSYSLDHSMTRPGEFRYDLSGHRDEEGFYRYLGQFDLGVARNLSANAAVIEAPVEGVQTSFARIGLRTFWQSVSLNGRYTESEHGGTLEEVGLQTRVAGFSVDANRASLENFVSDEFYRSSDPIETRDDVRITGSLGFGSAWRLPLTLEYERDSRVSGRTDTRATNRLSAYLFRTAMTNTVDWRSVGDSEFTTGTLLMSRRLYNVGLRGSVDYRISPDSEATNLALTADYTLREGYRLSAGVSRDLLNPRTDWSLGLSKAIGRFGLGLNGRFSTDGDYAVGLQFSVGLGREPRGSSWLTSAQPLAGFGAASVRMFVDDNGNGIMDEGEVPVPDAGFVVNGGRREVRTDKFGIAHVGRLPVAQYVDVGVDRSTLFDPQWEPTKEGVSLVPRPGHVARVDIPVQMTTEIDGTVHLWDSESDSGVGGINLELLDRHMNVVGKATTAWDGFYIVPRVPAGEYYLRVSPKQLKQLGLRDTGVRVVEVAADGSFISGVDMLVQRPGSSASRTAPRSAQAADRPEVQPESVAAADEDWLSRQPTGHYTIQLVGASSEQTVREYIERHGIGAEAVYFRTRRHGAPWYSVVYGSYRSSRAAETALNRLPAPLKQAAPWIRRFGDVQRLVD